MGRATIDPRHIQSEASLCSPASLDTLFRAERGRLLRYFNRRFGKEVAPDLVQDVFIRLVATGPKQRIDKPAAYLSRIARNLAVDRLRREKRNRPIFFPLDDETDAPVCPEQEWGREVKDLWHLYRETLRHMPSKTRSVFVMHRHRHLSYSEIAERRGISEATVEYHMMRALALLRAAIA